MTDISNNPRIGQTVTRHIEPGKSYGTGKREGTSGEPTLKQWYDGYDDSSGHHIGAKAYYDAVMSGQMQPDSQQAWSEFVSEYQWANGQLFGQGGGNWDPNAQGAGGPGGNGGPQAGQTNEFGGEMGPDGNYIYDTPGGKTQIGFTGDQTRNDIYGDDNQLILDMPSAKVTYEETQDHGQPVLKVIVTTSHGTAAYYYSDYKSPGFKLDIQTLHPDTQVTGPTITGVTSEKYDPVKASQPPTPQSSVEGSPVDGEPTSTYYEAASIDQTIDFHPTASGSGTSETHYVVGNSTISLPISSTADVENKGPYKVGEGGPFDYKVTVTHKDGSTDIIYFKKPFTSAINGVEGSITFNGTAPTGSTVPSGFDGITLNTGGASTGATGIINPNADTDTPYDKLDGDTATFNTQNDVNLTNYANGPSTVNITAGGNVTIHHTTNDDTVAIFKKTGTPASLGPAGSYGIWVTDATTGKQTHYVVKGPPSNINLDFMPANITYNGQPYQDGVDSSITVSGGGSTGGTGGTTATGKTGDILNGLKGNLTDAQFLNALKLADFSSYTTMNDVLTAINNGTFPPPNPSSDDMKKLIHFFYLTDPDFKSGMNSYYPYSPHNDTEVAAHRNGIESATTRLITLLQLIYPDNSSDIGSLPTQYDYNFKTDFHVRDNDFDLQTITDQNQWDSWQSEQL
jgi:hypothetical protein